MTKQGGMWVTFRHTPGVGFWSVTVHASALDALQFLETHKSDPPLIRFVEFGGELTL